MEGIRAYFDRALGSILLYRMERKQFDDIRKAHPDTLLSDMYGAEHLIRLFGTHSGCLTCLLVCLVASPCLFVVLVCLVASCCLLACCVCS